MFKFSSMHVVRCSLATRVKATTAMQTCRILLDVEEVWSQKDTQQQPWDDGLCICQQHQSSIMCNIAGLSVRYHTNRCVSTEISFIIERHFVDLQIKTAHYLSSIHFGQNYFCCKNRVIFIIFFQLCMLRTFSMCIYFTNSEFSPLPQNMDLPYPPYNNTTWASLRTQNKKEHLEQNKE